MFKYKDYEIGVDWARKEDYEDYVYEVDMVLHCFTWYEKLFNLIPNKRIKAWCSNRLDIRSGNKERKCCDVW